MDVFSISYACMAFLIAGLVKGSTGIGFSTTALPVMMFYIDPKVSIPLVIIPSITSNILVMAQSFHFISALKRFYTLYIATLPGLYAGVMLLGNTKSSVSRAVLGVVLFLYGIWAFIKRTPPLSPKAEKILRIPAALTTGIVNGLTGSQVMPMLPYMLSIQMDKDTFVQAINLSFTFSSLTMIILLNHMGIFRMENFPVAFLGLVPTAVGIYAGNKVRKSLNEEAYRKAVLFFLMIAGISLIIRSCLI